MGKRVWQLLSVTVGAALAVTGCAQAGGESEDEESAAEQTVETGPFLGTHDDVDGELIEGPEEVQPVILDEATACNAIIDTYHSHGLELGCATTTHVCPDMLRFAFGVACMQYQAPSVLHCVDTIHKATSCDELIQTSCAVEPVWGSSPQGCGDVE